MHRARLACSWQMLCVARLYLAYPITVNMENYRLQKVSFPAVMLCTNLAAVVNRTLLEQHVRFQITLDVGPLMNSSASVIFIHNETELFGHTGKQYALMNFLQSDLIVMDYAKTIHELLPPPFETNCVNYADIGFHSRAD